MTDFDMIDMVQDNQTLQNLVDALNKNRVSTDNIYQRTYGLGVVPAWTYGRNVVPELITHHFKWSLENNGPDWKCLVYVKYGNCPGETDYISQLCAVGKAKSMSDAMHDALRFVCEEWEHEWIGYHIPFLQSSNVDELKLKLAAFGDGE